MPLSIVARRPAAKIATSTTSARPIISAEAVTAVRCGWRRAFSRASMPVQALEARQRAADHAAQRPHEQSAPAARSRTSSARAPRPSSDAAAARRAEVAEQAVEQQRDAERLDHHGDRRSGARRRRPTPGVTLSRIAATGSHRASRGAPGTKPETIVATMPTTRPTMIVPRLEHRCSVVPRSIPNADSSAASAGREREAARAIAEHRREQADRRTSRPAPSAAPGRARRRACAAARTPSCAGRRSPRRC